jgi:hypothetical protein
VLESFALGSKVISSLEGPNWQPSLTARGGGHRFSSVQHKAEKKLGAGSAKLHSLALRSYIVLQASANGEKNVR